MDEDTLFKILEIVIVGLACPLMLPFICSDIFEEETDEGE